MNTREAIDKNIDDLRTLIEQAVRDEQLRHWLTGLPNASALQEHIQRAIRDDEPFWLAFIEIDKFKSINDQFGHERANVLLLEVAQSLEQTAPRFFANQAIAFHAHGDEFYVLGRTHPTKFARDEIAQKLDTMRDWLAARSGLTRAIAISSAHVGILGLSCSTRSPPTRTASR